MEYSRATGNGMFYLAGIIVVLGLGFISCTDSTVTPYAQNNPDERIASVVSTSHSVSTTGFDILNLGTLGGTNSKGWDINESGDVVGRSSLSAGTLQHAFLWESGSGMTDLGTLGGGSSFAMGINGARQVVGESATAGNETHAFIWEGGTGMTDLGTLGGNRSTARAINNSGQIVGRSRLATGASHAFIWESSSGMTSLGTLGGTVSEAWDINDNEQVTGYSQTSTGLIHAFIWEGGTGMTDLGSLGSHSFARDINNDGHVVGRSITSTGEHHAFLWKPGTGMMDLGTLGGSFSTAYGINNHGQVVGESETGFGELHAFLWEEGQGMTDLGTLETGAPQSLARDINDKGEATGFSYDTNFNIFAVKWSFDVPVLDPKDQLETLIGVIEGQCSQGLLNRGLCNSLVKKLEHTLISLDKGKTKTAENQLRSFINEVNALVMAGKLPVQTGSDWIDAVNEILSNLQ